MTEEGILTDIRFTQEKNASEPMERTEDGMITEVNPLEAKAPAPIEVTEGGIIIDFNPLQSKKVDILIDVIEDEREIELNPEQ